MNNPLFIVAQINVFGQNNHKVSPAFYDALLVIGVLLALSLIIFLVVALSKKPGKSRKRKSHLPVILENSREHLKEQEETAKKEQREGIVRRRKKRRRKKHHETFDTRNPTLAEMGGLPPIRHKDTPSDPGI